MIVLLNPFFTPLPWPVYLKRPRGRWTVLQELKLPIAQRASPFWSTRTESIRCHRPEKKLWKTAVPFVTGSPLGKATLAMRRIGMLRNQAFNVDRAGKSVSLGAQAGE